MKTKIYFPDLLKLGILIMLCLNFLAVSIQSVFASVNLLRYSDKQLVDMTDKAIKSKKWVDAAIYYSIYIDRKSNSYTANDLWMIDAQKNLTNLQINAQLDQKIATYVRDNNLYGSCAPVVNQAEYREAQTNSPISVSLLRTGPPPDETWAFIDIDFGGEWVALPVGNYYTAAQIGMPDNSISSLMVGNDVIAYLCTDTNLQGTCGVFVPLPKYRNSSWNQHPFLGNNTVGNDTISSIHVERRNSCVPGPYQATIFMHADYNSPCQTLEVGTYNNQDEYRLPDNSITAIRVGAKVKAYLCTDYNIRGSCEWITANDPNLGNNYIGNDSLSSISIEAKP
jgi:hypothetical protein